MPSHGSSNWFKAMRDLQTAFERLDDEQKSAVIHDSHTVVLAGPGSGKTATLVLKVAHLLASVIPAPRGVACITFNNDAVSEFRNRLAAHGIHSSRTLFLGTVHSFCLNCIIRPYGGLIDPSLRPDSSTHFSYLYLIESIA